MSLSQLLLCLMIHKSQLSTTVKEPTVFVIQPALLNFRRQDFIPPKKSANYNPSYGFEPYWPEGGWVFDRLETTTERKEGTICGEECNEMYIQFGEICGRDINYKRKTFKNYCELLDEDCTGRLKWMIAYRGACVSELKTYPTKQTELLTRASNYEYIFESIHPEKFSPRPVTNATTATTKIK